MANRIMVIINEYHLMYVVWDLTVVSPVVSDEILGAFPPLVGYYSRQSPRGTLPDLWVVEEGRTLQFGVFSNRTDMVATLGRDASQLIHKEDHRVGPLLGLFLSPGTGLMTAQAIIARTVAENLDTLQLMLHNAEDSYKKVDKFFESLVRKVSKLEASRAKVSEDQKEK